MLSTVHVLLELSIFLSLVNAKFVLDFPISDVKTLTQLPGSLFQLEDLVNNICWDLEIVLNDKTLATTCRENFWTPKMLLSHRAEVKVICRSKQTLHIEVKPSESLQIAVLIPADEKDSNMSINYSIIEPKKIFSSITVLKSSKSYVIYTTMLNKEGRPSLWRGESRVPAWNSSAEPQHTNYDVQIQFSNYSADETVNGVFSWNQTGDSDVCFDFTIDCNQGTFESTIILPDSKPRVVIGNLSLNDTCQITLKGLYGTTKLRCRTPAHVAKPHPEQNIKYTNYQKPPVTPPERKHIEMLVLPENPENINLTATEDGYWWRVQVSWNTPSTVQDSYNVTLRAGTIQNMTVAGNATEAVFTGVSKTETGLYNVSIYVIKGGYSAYNFARAEFPEIMPENTKKISLTATEDGDWWRVQVSWNTPSTFQDSYNVTLRAGTIQNMTVAGNATEAVFTGVTRTETGLYNVSVNAIKSGYRAHNFARGFFPGRSWSSELRWASAAGGAWGAVALCALALALLHRRLKKRFYKNQTLRQIPVLDSKAIEEDECLEPLACADQWEVPSERLQLYEVIGEGAFGVVRRGVLAPASKEVAVKMLKEFPTLDEKRCFRLEMELMKSVGAHPHVVSLVACCSGKRLAIVAEYCAEGDLLTFLRRSWDGMLSKRNVKYYNNNIDTDYRNDLFKCKVVGKLSAVANKEYDLQGMCDLTYLDLLSFCRQIAMGMEFLAANRVVHRDLAARNILVTRDKTLKIADFGLSRDVYQDNQYKQMGNGKMPVKWMAVESLTRRIYTSQSDVWSFGVVVWEVMTVGGAPYPGVPAARLPRLLRAGYRMPRPPNCTKQLYEVMVSCWRAEPRTRPTFAELHRRLDELLNCACADQYLCLDLDEEPPPRDPRPYRYFKLLIRGKRAWNRESYERPLKVHRGNHNHYTTPPATLK